MSDKNNYKAAGVLLFNQKGQVYLGIDRKGFLCDFGGKKEAIDNDCPLTTATRECREESSINPILSTNNSVYLSKSKYRLYLASTGDIPIPSNEIKEINLFDSIYGIDHVLHPRLRDRTGKQYISRWIAKTFSNQLLK
jgi:hypothetical protein